MLVMQYRIVLPADYDMGIIRRRVADHGARTDAFPGLGVKAYAIRERGVADSPVNQYSPFYLWADPAGMGAFLFGPGFAKLAADFGRPRVEHWTGLTFAFGPDRRSVPRGATRSRSVLGPAASLPDELARHTERVHALAGTPGVHSTAIGFDPASWEIVQFTLWESAAPPAGDERYEVLHLSSPELDRLAPADRARA